jgi:hypothetical protein
MRVKLRSISTSFASLLIVFSPLVVNAQMPKSRLNVGQRYHIAAEGLNVRSSNSTTAQNVVGKLSKNDVVEIYDVLNAATPLVQVKIITSISVKPNAAPELFVSKDYLSEKALSAESSSKYFLIQNIATEKTRVYERCTLTPGCPHTLIFETDTVVGRPEEGTDSDPKAYITWLGHSRIADWVKFYSDGAGTYPSWYTAGQDIRTIPGPISNSPSKLLGSKKWTVRQNGKSTMYGAFGWYAARLSPADASGVNHQWMHGTIGWGKDEDKAIELTRGVFVNMFSNPGSHGCTRLENRSIAFLRNLLPVGTDIYRVYARESTRENTTPLSRYADKYNNPGHWEYILLTDGAQKINGLTADAATIRGSGISVLQGVNFLEEGVFNYNRYPSAGKPDYSKSAASGKSGDRYQIDSGRPQDPTNFRGYFLVDEGRFVDYQHPDEKTVNGKVKVSGLADFRDSVPESLATAGAHYPPKVNYKVENYQANYN